MAGTAEKDGSQALGEREEEGHRRREGRPQGPVVGAEGATRKRGVQEEGRRLQGPEDWRQPPVAMDEGGVGHQVRAHLAQQRRALPSAQGEGEAVRRGVRPHHRQEAPRHRGGKQFSSQPREVAKKAARARKNGTAAASASAAKRRPAARAAPSARTAAAPRTTTTRRNAASARPTSRKTPARKTPAARKARRCPQSRARQDGRAQGGDGPERDSQAQDSQEHDHQDHWAQARPPPAPRASPRPASRRRSGEPSPSPLPAEALREVPSDERGTGSGRRGPRLRGPRST